ncbi:MAG: DUF2267 domain-containing protein [Streptosporangiaceae bacterium]
MSRTGVDSLDRSIDKTNAWLADVAANFGTEDRRLAYRVTRSWLHTLRDRLPVPIAAHIAAQLPELLRGVFYEGWNPSKVPIKYGKDEYIARFAKDAQIHHTEVPRAGRLVTSAFGKHLSAGAMNEAFGALPADIRRLVAGPDGAPAESASTNYTPGSGTAGGDQPADARPRAEAGTGHDAEVKGAPQ